MVAHPFLEELPLGLCETQLRPKLGWYLFVLVHATILELDFERSRRTVISH